MISKLIVDEMGYGYILCPPKWGLKDEIASFHRFYWVLGGDAHYLSATQSSDFISGNLYILPTFSPYTMWHDPLNPFEVIYFHIEIVPDITDGLLRIPISDNSLEISLLQTMRHFSDIREVQNLNELCGILTRRIVSMYRPRMTYDSRIEKIMRYIPQHITDKITVDELAQLACMERSHFTKVFKRHFNLSPMQYVTQQKMSFAARELLSGVFIGDISAAVAYEDEKAFSRAFKRVYGISPLEYKKNHNRQP
jgi:AraC-like DNA-binding protein